MVRNRWCRERATHRARAVGVALLPAAYLRSPGRARYLACQWAPATRYSRESLAGLRPRGIHRGQAEAARLPVDRTDLRTSRRGVQQRMFEAEVGRTGSVYEALLRVLARSRIPARSGSRAGRVAEPGGGVAGTQRGALRPVPALRQRVVAFRALRLQRRQWITAVPAEDMMPRSRWPSRSGRPWLKVAGQKMIMKRSRRGQ